MTDYFVKNSGMDFDSEGDENDENCDNDKPYINKRMGILKDALTKEDKPMTTKGKEILKKVLEEDK